jgi:4-alpha-glucanotransferase
MADISPFDLIKKKYIYTRMLSYTEHLLQTPAAQEWKKIGIRHHHGINVPLFALRSKTSGGIGEFNDLIPLIDWCRELGLDVIQLLPLNDGGNECSPYCSLSAIALNPLYLTLSALPYLEAMPNHQSRLAELQLLNNSQRITYPAVFKAKRKFLKEYFSAVGDRIINTNDYHLFLSRYPWIETYALFKAIKLERHWESWENWPPEMRNAGPKEYFSLLEGVNFQYCLQYFCFQQLQNIKKIAEQKGVFLKGDIPILINKESADVWHQRRFFHLDYVAGAPPDMYSKEGQKWGFPLYNWEALESDHYNWWKIRLNVASAFYPIYRIDHMVGFFRIWGMKNDEPAKQGHYFPADRATWIAHGKKILEMMLSSCCMLPIGEDLGTVPPEVRICLRELGICGTKVMRWERNWNTDKSFIPPEKYIPESMTTVSTHDSETLQLWWQNNPQDVMDFCKYKGWKLTPSLIPEYHQEILWDSHHSGSFFHINLLNEYLALVPGLTWPKLEDERINIPNLVSDFNWSYRFKPSVEEIVTNESLHQIIKKVVC